MKMLLPSLNKQIHHQKRNSGVLPTCTGSPVKRRIGQVARARPRREQNERSKETETIGVADNVSEERMSQQDRKREEEPDVAPCFSKYRVGLVVICRVSTFMRQEQTKGSFLDVLGSMDGWTDLAPKQKQAFLPTSLFSNSTSSLSIENVLQPGMLIKAMIMKLGRRGMIVSTSALEKREGDMLGSMQSCFENARSMHVGSIFDRAYRKEKKTIKRVVMSVDQASFNRWHKTLDASWPLSAYHNAPQLSDTNASMDIMAQHVRQAALSPSPLLELHGFPDQDQHPPAHYQVDGILFRPNRQSSSYHVNNSASTLPFGLKRQVRLHSIPGGADVLVPQNKLQMRSVGAPHEAAAVTVRAASVAVEGILVSHLRQELDRRQKVGQGFCMLFRYLHLPTHEIQELMKMHATFQGARWGIVVRDAIAGARIRLLSDIEGGSLTGSIKDAEGSKEGVESKGLHKGGERLSIGAVPAHARKDSLVESAALPLALLLEAKEELLSMPLSFVPPPPDASTPKPPSEEKENAGFSFSCVAAWFPNYIDQLKEKSEEQQGSQQVQTAKRKALVLQSGVTKSAIPLGNHW